MELPTTEPLTALGRHPGEAADDTDNDHDDTEDLQVGCDTCSFPVFQNGHCDCDDDDYDDGDDDDTISVRK